jgi:20S proteasome subunit alpha 2
MGDSSYNFSLTTFSKTGKLLQIEYALNRVLQGKVALGIRGKAPVCSRAVVHASGRVVGCAGLDLTTCCVLFCCSGCGLLAARNGVVLASDKKVPTTLVDAEEVQKASVITPNCGFVYAGLCPLQEGLVFGHGSSNSLTPPLSLLLGAFLFCTACRNGSGLASARARSEEGGSDI